MTRTQAMAFSSPHRKTSGRVIRTSSMTFVSFLCALVLTLSARAQLSTQLSVPRTTMVTVEKDVKLEVLDWGGTGRPLILLQGLGGVAHDYDTFAPQFTARHHVYAI